ncbi:polysaccharide deacetylase family protein [Candidatus Omnitrophota bacterium]
MKYGKFNYMNIRGAWRLRKTLTQLNRRGIILMYHRVEDLESDPWNLSVSPARFAEHMQIIKKLGRPVQMREMGKSLKRFSFGRKEIVVTFDDGYADNFHNARPVLEQNGIPATFFITTGATDRPQEFWWDEIGRTILTEKMLPEIFDLTIAGRQYRWQITPVDQREIIEESEAIMDTPQNDMSLSRDRLFYVLWKIIDRLPFLEKKDILQQVAQWAGASSDPREDHLPMTSKELKTLASSSLFEIGAHTVHHPMLSRLLPEEQEKEIVCSKHDLEELLNEPITSFCYPHGDYSKETVKILKSLRFKNACTVTQGTVERNNDPFLLPRVGVLNWSGVEFEKNLKRWMDAC